MAKDKIPKLYGTKNSRTREEYIELFAHDHCNTHLEDIREIAEWLKGENQ